MQEGEVEMRELIIHRLKAQTKRVSIVPVTDDSNIVMEVIELPNGEEVTLIYDEDESKRRMVISC